MNLKSVESSRHRSERLRRSDRSGIVRDVPILVSHEFFSQAIADAKARKEAQDKEKEKEREKEKEKAAKELTKKKQEERERKSQEVKRSAAPVLTEKEERQKAMQQMTDGLYEEAIQSISRVLVSHGSKMAKAEYNKLVDHQRFSILQCVKKGASHSFGLSLPAAISETRDFRKDVVDEVLVRLALGELDEALAACDKVSADPVVAGVNLRAEVLVSLAASSEAAGKAQQAAGLLAKAIRADSSRRKELEVVVARLQAKLHPAGAGGSSAGGSARSQAAGAAPSPDQRKGGGGAAANGLVAGVASAGSSAPQPQPAAKPATPELSNAPTPTAASVGLPSATPSPPSVPVTAKAAESPLADLGWASTGLGPLAGGHKSVSAVPDFGNQRPFGAMAMAGGGFGMQGNGMDGAARQSGLMGGMMQVRVGGPGNGARMDYVGVPAAGGGMGGFSGGAMLHGMPPAGCSLGGPAHPHVAMGGGLMSGTGMRGGLGGGMKGGMVGGMGPGHNGFLMQPFDPLAQDPLASGGMAHDPSGDVSLPPAPLRDGDERRAAWESAALPLSTAQRRVQLLVGS